MINLMSFYYETSFQYQRKDTLEQIKQSLCYHLDHYHKYNWSKDDIIIKTNFSFTYKDFKSTNFLYHKPIDNLFFSKIIAAYEVACEHPDTIIWHHDHDTFQLKPFPKSITLTHDINMCSRWAGNPLPNSASVFYKGLSPILKEIYEYIQVPSSVVKKARTDEDIFRHFHKSPYSLTTTLPFEYNTSLTKYTSDRRKAIDPYCVHGDPFRRRWDARRYHEYLQKCSFRPA